MCREGEPCTKPARNVVLVFARDGRVAARATTSGLGTYRVLLAAGRYVVTAPAYRIGSGVTPRVVRVRPGVVARVDLRIDTGLQ